MKFIIKKSFYSFKELSDTCAKKIKEILWILGKNAFLCILIFILIDILIGEFLFYKYVISIDTKEPKVISTYDKFQENTYLSILEEWQKREDISENLFSSDKNYTDPFKQNQNELK